jgi:lipid-A-disaccharide synthase-like uncharacterized protein
MMANMTDQPGRPWWRDPRSMGPGAARWAWLTRQPTNWWLRLGLPGLMIFGFGFLIRLLFAEDMGGYAVPFGVLALVFLASVLVGLAKERGSRR